MSGESLEKKSSSHGTMFFVHVLNQWMEKVGSERGEENY